MRVADSCTVDASREDVWKVINDPERFPDILCGITRWEHEGGPKSGLGARYNMRMAVGSAQVGGLVEIVECDHPGDLAWTNITGIDHRGRWRLREAGDGRTKVSLRLSYQSPGGLLGLGTDYAAAYFVKRNIRRSLRMLKDLVED